MTAMAHLLSSLRTGENVILVTGGAGFIGSYLVEYLLRIGVKVRVLDNLTTGSIKNISSAFSYGNQFQFIQGDVGDLTAVHMSMAGVDAIVHLAAQVSVQQSLSNPMESAATNVCGLINILEAAKNWKIRRVIFSSSAAVYGHPKELPLNENSVTKPISPYGLEKLVGENYMRLYSDLHGISCLSMRLSNVYGPRQCPNPKYSGVISRYISQIKDGLAITVHGDGSQSRDYIYVADIVEIIAHYLRSEQKGELCVGTGRSTSLLELIENIKLIAGYDVQIEYSPLVSGDIEHSCLSPRLLRAKLGKIKFTSLRDGLQEVWRAA